MFAAENIVFIVPFLNIVEATSEENSSIIPTKFPAIPIKSLRLTKSLWKWILTILMYTILWLNPDAIQQRFVAKVIESYGPQ